MGDKPFEFVEDDGPKTRKDWLINNIAVAIGEGCLDESTGGGKNDLWKVTIETRLGLDEALRTEADERLGNAYIACLNQYEAEPDARALSRPWAPLSADELIDFFKITRDEAETIVMMVAKEYSR